jgi:hypothetical protein
MLAVGWCLSVLVGVPHSLVQGRTIFAIHAIQLALELLIRPEPSALDTFLNSFGMVCDLLPLIIAIMPMEACGVFSVETQVLLLASAMLNTCQRIFTLMFDLLPQGLMLLGFLGSGLFKFIKHLRGKYKERKAELRGKGGGGGGGGGGGKAPPGATRWARQGTCRCLPQL